MGRIAREDGVVRGSGNGEDLCIKSGKFEDDFKVTRRLGSGAQAEVFECVHRWTKEIQAVKMFSKRMNDGRREARYLRKLQSHPNVISLKDCYEGEDSFSLVMECGMMDLMDYALNHMVVPWDGRSNFPKLREGQLAHLARGMARAVCHCHSQGFLHRDIKTTNFAMGSDGQVKLLDFGFAFSIKSGKFPKACVGTAEFWAHEVATKDVTYGTPADIFALGVTFYHLLTGRLPDIKSLKNQQREIIDVRREELKSIPTQAQSLLRGMLQYNPQNRLTIIQVLQHPWLSEKKNESIKLYSHYLQSQPKDHHLPWMHGIWKNSKYSANSSKNSSFSQNIQQNQLNSPQITKQFSKDDSANIQGAEKIKNKKQNKTKNAREEETSGRKSPLKKMRKLAKYWWAKFSIKPDFAQTSFKKQQKQCQKQQKMYMKSIFVEESTKSHVQNVQNVHVSTISHVQNVHINKNSNVHNVQNVHISSRSNVRNVQNVHISSKSNVQNVQNVHFNNKNNSIKPLIYNHFFPMQMQGNELKVLLPPIFKGRNFKVTTQA